MTCACTIAGSVCPHSVHNDVAQVVEMDQFQNPGSIAVNGFYPTPGRGRWSGTESE